MSTEESKKNDKEVSLTRRALIKAGWAVPIILSIALPVGDVFVHATGVDGRGRARERAGGRYRGYRGQR